MGRMQERRSDGGSDWLPVHPSRFWPAGPGGEEREGGEWPHVAGATHASLCEGLEIGCIPPACVPKYSLTWNSTPVYRARSLSVHVLGFEMFGIALVGAEDTKHNLAHKRKGNEVKS